MTHSCVEMHAHIIFSTKDRMPLIKPEMESRLYSYLAGIAKKRKTPFLNINGIDDHIHIVLKLHQDVALSTLMRELKAYSTAWMKKEGNSKFSWQEGYGAFACSKSLLDKLIRYVEQQKEHHKKYSFKEEISLLEKKMGITWFKD